MTVRVGCAGKVGITWKRQSYRRICVYLAAFTGQETRHVKVDVFLVFVVLGIERIPAQTEIQLKVAKNLPVVLNVEGWEILRVASQVSIRLLEGIKIPGNEIGHCV